MGKSPKILLSFSKRSGKLIGIFRSLSDASRIFNVSRQSITNCAKGKIKTCAGYQWRMLDDDWVIDTDDLKSLSIKEFDSYINN